MPTINDYRSKYPSLKALDDAALIDRVAEVQGVSREDVMAHMGYKPKPRGILSFANDTVIETANAIAGGVKSVGDFVAPGNPVSEFIDTNIIKSGEAKQSDVVKAEKARFRGDMESAEGVGDEVSATLGYVARNPIQSLAQAAGSFAIPGAAVKGAGMLATAGNLGAKGVARAGLAGGAVAGAALSGGDAAGTAYELVKKAGGTDEEAEGAARQASVLPAAIGAAGGLVGAERLLAGAGGFKGGILSRALKTAGVEGAQEAVEEGVTQYEGQRAAVPFDPSIDPTKGVAGAATMGAVLGGATGGAVSLLSGEPAQAKKPGVADILGAPDLDKAIDFSMEAVSTPAKKGADPLGLAKTGDGLPFEADPRFAGAPILRGGDRPAAPIFGSKQQADIYIGEQALFQTHEAVEVAPGRWEVRPTAATLEMLKPRTDIPVGEVTEGPPVGEARELTDEERAAYLNQAPLSYRRAMERGLPQPEVTEVIPTGEATELEPIPVGEATEYDPPANMVPRRNTEGRTLDLSQLQTVRNYVERMQGVNTPAARAFVQDYRAGRITDDDVMGLIVPNRRADPTPDERIAAAAAQAPKQEVQPGDILTADGMPYGSKTAANVRAVKEGLTPANVIEIPGAGWVVRPKEAPSVNQPDVAGTPAQPVADGAGRAPDALGGELAVGRVPSDARGQQPGTATGVAQSGAGDAPAGTGNATDTALTDPKANAPYYVRQPGTGRQIPVPSPEAAAQALGELAARTGAKPVDGSIDVYDAQTGLPAFNVRPDGTVKKVETREEAEARSRRMIADEKRTVDAAPDAPSIERNAFGMPIGYRPGQAEQTTAGDLKAGDWIKEPGNFLQVRGVRALPDGRVELDLDGMLSRQAVTVPASKQVTRLKMEPTASAAAPTTDAPTLTTGDRVRLGESNYTVVSATPSAVKLQGADGGTKMVATNSKTYGQIQGAKDGDNATVSRVGDAGDQRQGGERGRGEPAAQLNGAGVDAGSAARRNADANLPGTGAVSDAPRREPGSATLKRPDADPAKRKRQQELIGRLNTYERDIVDRVENRGQQEDSAHNSALGMAGLTEDGLLQARGWAGLYPTMKPGVVVDYSGPLQDATGKRVDAQQAPAPRTQEAAPTAVPATPASAAGTGTPGVEADGLKAEEQFDRPENRPPLSDAERIKKGAEVAERNSNGLDGINAMWGNNLDPDNVVLGIVRAAAKSVNGAEQKVSAIIRSEVKQAGEKAYIKRMRSFTDRLGEVFGYSNDALMSAIKAAKASAENANLPAFWPGDDYVRLLLADMGRINAGDTAATPNAEAPVQAAPRGAEAAPVASAPSEADDYLTQLFGTPAEQAASQDRLMAGIAQRKQDTERIRGAIDTEKKRAQADYDDWSNRTYKRNKTQVDLRGDGPSNQASMSISAINESRRRNAMEALTQELKALDKLGQAVATDSGAEQFMATMRAMLERATKIAADGTGLFKTADEQFQYMLLDDLKVRGPGGKGNVTSNGLSKAVLAAIKPGAAPTAALTPKAQAVKEKLAKPLDELAKKLDGAEMSARPIMQGGRRVLRVVNQRQMNSALSIVPDGDGFKVVVDNDMGGGLREKIAARLAEMSAANVKENGNAAGNVRNAASAERPGLGDGGGTAQGGDAGRGAGVRADAAGNPGDGASAGNSAGAGTVLRDEVAGVATHKDPGEPAEPVTPAVVREAIKTGVQDTGRKPSAMKAELLAAIDQAVQEAPDYNDFQAVVKSMGLKDATAVFVGREGSAAMGEKSAPKGYSRPTRTFKVEGDGVFTVNNTVRQLLTFRDKVEKSPGFKDRQAPSGLNDRATDALDRRSTDAAVANMVDEGDFQAALDYAEAKGVDIANVKLSKLLRDRLEKWQKDQASAKAIADYEAARAEGKPAPGSLAAAFAEKEAEAAPAPAAEPEADDIPEAGVASQTFDQWVRAKYAGNEYKDKYLEEFGGDERRAILGAAIGSIDNDLKTPDLLREAKDQYRRDLFALPREAAISMEVYDALTPVLQNEAIRHFYDLSSRITRRTQDETKARVEAERIKKAPYEAAFAEVDAEIRRLDALPGPETQKQKDLSARRERLREALYQIGQGKEPDGRLLRKTAEPDADAAPAQQAAAILDAAAEPPKGAERLSVIKDVKAGAITPDEVAAAYPPAEAQETTDAQRQQAADHAKDLGGRVVWQRGDLALIEGYSLLSGDSVYIAANGSQRTRVDIKSFTGKGYTEAEKAELMQARADAVRAADELLARNPDGPFADAPLVFADDIPAAVQGVVRGWIRLLGLDGARIVVTTPASGAAMADGLAGKFRRIGKANLSGDNTNGTMQPLGGDDFHIAVRPGVSTLKALEVLAHELGHIVERRAFAQADAGTQQAIREAHAEWLKKNGGGRALDMAQAMRAYRSGQTTGFSEDAKAIEAGAYWRSFGEWFADQVSRWATTQDRPVGVVEQFFKRLADRLRVFFTGERAKFKPNTTVAQWLDSLAKDVPPVEAPAPAAAAAATTGPAPMPAVGGISMSLAQQAHAGTSFVPERRAAQERDSFTGALRDAWDRAARIAGTDPAAIARITEVFTDVADGYRARYTATLQARSRVMSAMIAGPARFPVERNRKRMETERKRAEEASEFLERGIKRLIRAARGPIDNSPESELERVRLNLSQREELQETMKAANAALRKDDDAALEDLGFTAEQIADLKKGSKWERGFPAYRLTNNSAEIRRLRERLQSAEERLKDSAAGPVETERPGVKIVEDATDDRLRLIFDGKPSEEVRNDLKANGFKWSPKNDAWQRQLTDNARYAAKQVLDKHYPTDDAPADGGAKFSRRRMTPAERANNFSAWGGGAPVVDREQASTRGFKTGEAVVVEAYHGTARPDRVGTVFQAKRATSGPMAFFTSDPTLASSYAQGKEDTSIGDEYDGDYSQWFKVKTPGRRAQDIAGAWWSLTPEQRDKITDLAPRVVSREDDDGNYSIELADEGHTNGVGNYEYEYRKSRNPLRALVENWLASGWLFNEEQDFLKVLKAAGFPMDQVEYDNPRAKYPAVYKTFIRMGNPLVTSDIPQRTMDALEQAAKRDRSRPATGGVDQWDKNTRTVREWVAQLNDPERGSYAWTSIPDKVTAVLRNQGYDGIIDWSGKGGGSIVAPVYIPFAETQVKSAIGNKGTFDPEKKDILYSRAQPGRTGVPMTDAKAVVAAIREALPTAPPIQIHDSVRKAPENLRRLIRQAGADNDVEAAYHEGEIHVFPGNIASIERMQFVVAHHEIRHHGLRSMLGPAMGPAMLRMYASNPNLKAAADAKMDAGLANTRVLAVEEALADMPVDELQKLTGWQRIVSAARQWLRQAAANLRRAGLTSLADAIEPTGWTDADIASLVQRAEEVSRGRTAPFRTGGTVFSEGDEGRTDQTQTPAFRRWFGDSKVVDAQGRPLAVFHGTQSAGFTEFGTPAYFTSGAGEAGMYSADDSPQMVRWRGARTADKFNVAEVQEGISFSDRDWWTPGAWYLVGDGVFRKTEGGKLEMSTDGSADYNYATGKIERIPTKEAMSPGTYRVYLSIQNPAYLDWKTASKLAGGGNQRGRVNDALIAELKAKGHDGVIADSDWGMAKHYIPFSPEQIKSATGNNGEYDPGNADIRFSRSAGTAKVTAQRQVAQAVRNTVADYLGNAGAKVSWWDKTLATQYAKAEKFPAFKRVFDGAQQYLEDVSSLANQAADKAPSILPKLETWKDLKKFGLSEADAKAVAGPIFTGTLTDEKVYSDAELRSKFNLTPAQIGQYREFLATVNESLDQVVAADVLRLLGDKNPALRELAVEDRAALRDGVQDYLEGQIAEAQDPDTTADLQQTLKSIQEKYARVDDLKAKGYSPLMRFGQYAVNVEDPATGESLFFGLYESRRAANAAFRDLQQDPKFARATITQGVLSEEQYKLFSAVPMESLEMFAEAIGASDNEVFQAYLRLAKNNRSALKRMIQRKGTAGFSEDVPRVLAAFTTSNARLASNIMNMAAAKEAAMDIRDGDIKDEAIKLVETVSNPGDRAGWIRGLMFMQFIGGSVASALVNLTQPVTMTLPYLSQFGGTAKASARLLAAGKTAAGGKPGNTALALALKRAEADGVVSPQEIHHLVAQASGSWGNHPWLKRAAFVWSAPFSLAEQFNRRVTFIAAWNTAKEQGIEDPFGFASKAVVETQGLYSTANMPNWARSPLGAAALTFKQFSIHYLEWMGRMWKSGPAGKKAVAVALALLILMAGTDGLPFADDMDDLVDTLAQALGYDLNSKKARREFVANTLGFGDEGADVAARGFSALAGFPLDVSLRMSMGNLLPGSGILLRSNTDKSGALLEVAGPAGSLAKQYLEGAAGLLRGEPADAAKLVVPIAVQNVIKGAEMAATGEARDQLGRKVMDVDAMDAAVKAVGFNPSSIARESQKISMVRRSEQLAKNVEGEIAADWARAIVDKDQDGIADARRKLAEWNEDNPDNPIRITMQQLIQRAKKLRQTREQRFITTVSPERRQAVAEAIR